MDLLSVPEAAEVLKVTPGWVLQLIYKGRLNADRVGWQWVLERAEVERYNAERRPAHRPSKSPG